MTITEVSAGALRGEPAGDVLVFRGVPYAAPPVGDRRWRAPEPVGAWSGVRDATTFGPVPPQSVSPERLAKRGRTMGEDCLHLNVWTPGCDGVDRPVVVFLHGGGVVLGSASAPLLDGARLAARGDVVVVTVGFRLGALGSLHAPGRAATNVALRDQLLALRWVREEIGAFGGDPGRVTVAGQSSGAVAIACMLASPAAAGLFDRAILQSGGLERVRSTAAATAVARRFFDALGDVGHEPSVEAILAAQATIPTGFVPPEGPWHHCIDGDLVPEHPLVAAARRPLHAVPLLAGTTRDEWRTFDAALPDGERTGDHLRTRARALLGDGALLDDVLDRYRAEHGDDDAAIGSAIVTDFHFTAPTEQLLRAHAGHGNPAFRYELRGPSPRPGIGAGHDTCLPLVFGTMEEVPALVGTGADAAVMSEAVQDAWIAFVRGGEPWTRYDGDRRTTMLLGAERHEAERHREAQLAVWEGRYPAAG